MAFAIQRLKDFQEGAAIIRDAFITVATDLHLTEENAPSNPAFMGSEILAQMDEKGVELYMAYEDGQPIGFVALEQANPRTGYLEKLAVLPEHRHKGYGEKLVEFVVDRARSLGIERISIGIINENVVLKDWYLRLGFKETGTKRFSHLPFEVCFMEKMTK